MKLALHNKILIALGLAFAIGLSANLQTSELAEKPNWFVYLSETCLFLGTVFLNALKMIVIPLIMTSIICGVAKIGNQSNFKRLGFKTLGFYLISGLLAVTTGLLCVNLWKPGVVDEEIREKMIQTQESQGQPKLDIALNKASDGWSNLIEVFHRMIPTNLFKAAVEGQLLGLIFFSLLFGFFISKLSDSFQKTQVEFWESLNCTILKLTNFIISFAPFGVFGLVTPTLMKVGIDTLSVMGGFALTVLLGLFIHSFLVLPLMLKVLPELIFGIITDRWLQHC